jgi:hypothetical protein
MKEMGSYGGGIGYATGLGDAKSETYRTEVRATYAAKILFFIYFIYLTKETL